MGEMSAFIKEAPERALGPSTMGGHSNGVLAMNQEAGSHQTYPWWYLDLELPSLQNCEKCISVVLKPPRLWCIVVTVHMDEHRDLILEYCQYVLGYVFSIFFLSFSFFFFGPI